MDVKAFSFQQPGALKIMMILGKWTNVQFA